MAFTLALLVAAPVAVLAAPQQWDGLMTWGQVVTRAQSFGFAAQLAALDSASAQSQAAQTRSTLFPQISVSGTAMNSSLVQLGMPAARQTYASLNASLPLFAPQMWASVSGAQADAYASQALALAQTDDAVLLALQLYDRAGLATAIIDDRQASLRDQQAHLVNTQERVRTGKSARYVLFRDLAGVASAEQGLTDAQAQRDEALNDLALSLDLALTSHIAVALPPPEPLRVDAATLHARALLQRPELLAAQHALTAQNDRLRAARSAYVPSVSVGVQTYSGTSSPPLGQTGSQIGITATLPLVDGGARSAQIRQAEIGFTRAQVLYDRARLSVERDVANALREYDAAQAQLTAATAGLQDAQAQLRIAKLRERAGKGIELETLDALATQATARENLSRAIARYDDALATVHHAAGDYAMPLSKGV
jgi:multidrug efflux system outer membrane protein